MERVAPPRLETREDARAVRRIFDDGGYRAEEIQRRLGTSDTMLSRTPDRPVYLRRLDAEEPTALLIRLFALDDAVSRSSAESVLGGDAVALLARVGLVADEAGHVRGTVRVVPHDHLLIASDQYTRDRADHVAAVHGPSATLAHLTVRGRVRSALDVGTGNGIQALLAAAHSDRVVATDVNERALAFAAFNGALNGIDNVEWRTGNYFEPAAGDRFDLVVANPPYVISPESQFLFRDSGLPGDSVSERVARETPRHLDEGGFATVMLSWVQSGEDVTGRPRSWWQGCGCDAILLHSGTDDPLTVAASWNRESAGEADEYAGAIDRWVEYFAREGITAISFGSLVLRRRDGRNWFRAARMPSRRLQPAGHQLERMFTASDWLATLPDELALLDERPMVADDVYVERELRFRDGRWVEHEAGAGLAGGLGFTADLDEVTSALLDVLDGTRTVREALPTGRASLEPVAARVTRQMLELGFLIPPIEG